MLNKPRNAPGTQAAGVLLVSRSRAIQELKAALRNRFPRTKFTLKVGAKTGSIYLQWFNGPSMADVDEISSTFAGLTIDPDLGVILQITMAMIEGDLVPTRFDLGFIIPDRIAVGGGRDFPDSVARSSAGGQQLRETHIATQANH